ncbi:MAG: glycosyl transferase [Rhodospirillales bacterium]|nr:glycosyl transferase [Rhodospirillales bacterium]
MGFELTVLMPCLNEARTLATCIGKARAFIERTGIAAEIIIADNGSTDGSQAIAIRHGARVIHVPRRGYGSALMAGIETARGRYVIMGDADDSYDFGQLDAFVAKLREGYQLVMGNRFRGGIRPGAMPPLHRYLGNPVLTGIGRLFYGSACGDFHCGLRGFDRDAIRTLSLTAPGMEFASEMVVKATIHQLRITEVPTTLDPDGRDRAPHLRSWHDGWRHLRFMLLLAPRWLFLHPGLLLVMAGTALTAWLIPGPRRVGNLELGVHTLLYACTMIVLGAQAVSFWVFAKLATAREGLLRHDAQLERFLSRISLETGLKISAALILLGIAGIAYTMRIWGSSAFGALTPAHVMRFAIPASTAIVLGFQLFASFFMIAVLGLRAKPAPATPAEREAAHLEPAL